jgi:predicted phosphoribosyltransferase
MRLDYGDGPLFADRFEAGAQLGARVREMSWPDPVVLGMARGGVPAVAEILDAPLDVAVARKIGAPGRPEFGVGAVTAEGPARYDESTLAALGLTPADLLAACERERAEARRRLARYRDNAEALPVTGRDVLLVDDGAGHRGDRPGCARGAVYGRPAADGVRRAGVRADTQAALRAEADDVVCMAAPAGLGAVGHWYRDFRQTSDEEVLAALTAGRRRLA